MEPKPTDDKYITEKQASELTGLSVAFFQKKRWQGDGPPFIRVSARAIRYKESVLRAWMDEREKMSTSHA